MEIMVDALLRKKIVCRIDKNRVFFLEIPADAVLAEVYSVVNELQNKLWEEMEKEREHARNIDKAEEKKSESEVIEEPKVEEQPK